MAGYDKGLEGGELQITSKTDRKKYDNGPEGEAWRDATMNLERREYQDEVGGWRDMRLSMEVGSSMTGEDGDMWI